jgi:hypothetical protein
MGFILLGVLVLVSIALVIRGWRNYEAELRKTPNSGDSTYPFAAVGDAGPITQATIGHSTHHGDFGCADSHHGGCDSGGHGFDGGGHH